VNCGDNRAKRLAAGLVLTNLGNDATGRRLGGLVIRAGRWPFFERPSPSGTTTVTPLAIALVEAEQLDQHQDDVADGVLPGVADVADPGITGEIDQASDGSQRCRQQSESAQPKPLRSPSPRRRVAANNPIGSVIKIGRSGWPNRLAVLTGLRVARKTSSGLQCLFEKYDPVQQVPV